MIISKITIEAFKAFGAAQAIEFAIPTGSRGSGLTLLVGQNNSGKTSVIDAFRLLLNTNGIFDENQRRAGMFPKIELRGQTGLLRAVRSDPNRRYGIAYDGEIRNDSLRIVSSRRSWTSRFANETVSNEFNYWTQVNSRRDHGQHYELLMRLRSIEGVPDTRARFSGILKQLIPNFGDWSINYRDGNFVVEYAQANSLWHQADVLGDGILNCFQLAVAILDTTEQCVLLVDEPELSLHPQAQKAVAATLKALAKTRQVVVATHSPYFVDFEVIANGAKLWRFSLDGNECRVRSFSSETVSEFKKALGDYQEPQLFDVVAKEMFFDTNVMFVEGQEDVGLFRRYARKRDAVELPLFGYGIGGASQIERFLRMAQELGIKCGVLLDGTEVDKLDSLRVKFPDALIHALSSEDIRDKEPQPERRGRIGTFFKTGELKPEFEASFVEMYNEFVTHFGLEK